MGLIFPNTVAPERVAQALSADLRLRVWLDDDMVDRRAPDGWVHVTTAAQAIALIDSGLVAELSLDHDLGGDEIFGRGVDVIDFICEQQVTHGRDLWPHSLRLHTANPYARETMARAIKRYASQLHELTMSMPNGQIRFRFQAPAVPDK